MTKFLAIGTCSGSKSKHETLEAAKTSKTSNLIVETDDQFWPLKINRAWTLGAYADRSAEWFQTSIESATERIAEMAMQSILRASD